MRNDIRQELNDLWDALHKATVAGDQFAIDLFTRDAQVCLAQLGWGKTAPSSIGRTPPFQGEKPGSTPGGVMEGKLFVG